MNSLIRINKEICQNDLPWIHTEIRANCQRRNNKTAKNTSFDGYLHREPSSTKGTRFHALSSKSILDNYVILGECSNVTLHWIGTRARRSQGRWNDQTWFISAIHLLRTFDFDCVCHLAEYIYSRVHSRIVEKF